MIVPRNLLPVTVIKVTPVPTPGNLRALVDISIGPLLIHSCRIVQQPGQAAWVSMPQTQSADGRWYPCLRTDDDDLRQAVRERVLRAAASAGVLRSDSEQQAVAA